MADNYRFAESKLIKIKNCIMLWTNIKIII